VRAHALALTGIAALAACHTIDPANDDATLRADVQTRAGTALPAPPTSLAGLDDEIVAMLRSPLDAESAVRIALRNNRRVQATFERLGIARADLLQASRLRNPVFDGDARFLLDGGTELELGLAAPFVDLLQRPLRERLAAHEFAAARALLAAELVQLVFAVRRAVVHAQAAQQASDLRREAVVAAGSAHELAVALHAAGNYTDQQLAMERVGESRARLDLAAAELAASEATEPLQRLLGLWGAGAEWTLAGPLPADPLLGVDLAHAESRAIAASLAIAAHRARLDALAQKVRLRSWQQWLPDGALGASAIREPGGDWGLGPHVALELPLFDDGAPARDHAAHTLAAELLEHTQLAVEIRSAARTLRQRAAVLADAARFQRDVHLPYREAVVRTTLQTYNAMQIGAFDVLLARRRQLDDEREHVTTLRDAHLARLDLQELLAGSLPRSTFAASLHADAAGEPAPPDARGHE
jgi:cobalt-zinc-cadmium efflux system outer membrane protein